MTNTTIKAVVAKVQIGHITIDGLMMPDGSFAIAIPQAADLLKISRNTASRDFERLLGDKFKPFKQSIEGNNSLVNVLDMEQLFSLLLALYNSKTEKSVFDLAVAVGVLIGKDVESLKILHVHNKRKKVRTGNKQDEKEIQKAYHARLGGQIEVKTPLGNIDLLTEDALYEFKYYKHFKEALGQVLCYQKFAKKPKSYIVLFGCPKGFKYHTEYSQMLDLCEDYGIRLRILG